jgi:hypothetical protein
MLCPSSGTAGAGGERVAAFTPGAETPDALAEADLLVLDKPGRLTPEWVQFLAGMMLRGRPTLYVASEPADAENLAALSQSCGHSLTLPVTYAAWQSGAPEKTPRGFRSPGAAQRLELTDVRAGVPPFQAFGEDVPALAKNLAASRVLKTTPEKNGAAEEVLARWSDGSAALVSTRVGSGQLLIWNADLLASTLPKSAFFVALMRETAAQLLTDPLAVADREVPCGAARTLLLPPDAGRAEGLSLIGPNGARIEEFDLREEKNGLAWRWAPVGGPGVYRVQRGDKTVFAAATACPPDESDLRPVAASALGAQLAPKTAALGQEAQHAVAIAGLPGQPPNQEAAEIWPWLLVAALAFVLSELVLLKVFRV